jgi:ribonuclease P protein component
VGIIVPKHRHTAVLRNRLKRRLRELVRCELLPIVTTGDWVIRTRPEAYDASFDALRDDVRKIGGR